MWECNDCGIHTIPDPRSARSGARVGLMISFGDKKSEIHPLYPAAKHIRINNPNISLLTSEGQLNGQAKRRAENATHLIFCLSDHLESSPTNFQGKTPRNYKLLGFISSELRLLSALSRPDANVLVLFMKSSDTSKHESFLELAEKVQSSIGETRRFKMLKVQIYETEGKCIFDKNCLKTGFNWLYK